MKLAKRLGLVMIFLTGVFIGGIVVYIFPVPFPDMGHRLFGVKNEYAAEVLLAILNNFEPSRTGLKKSWAFDSGPTHQIVMNDRVTVFAWFDKEADNLSKNAISLAVDNPKLAAVIAKHALQLSGFSAELFEPAKDLPPDTLVLVETDALLGSALVFRKPFWRMPSPKLRE